MNTFHSAARLALALLMAVAAGSGQATTYTYRVPSLGVRVVQIPTQGSATSGLVFKDGSGATVTSFFIAPNQQYPLTVVNTGQSTVRGYLGSSDQGFASVALADQSCGQTASTPAVLTPGSSCTFTLKTGNIPYGHPDDTFSLKDSGGAAIQNVLTLQGSTTVPTDGGGTTAPLLP